MFNSNKNSNNGSIKEFIVDYAGLLGKVFLAGAAVVSGVKIVGEAVKADKDFTDKWALK